LPETKSLLLVEDEDHFATALSRAFKRFGLELVRVSTLEEARHAIDLSMFRAILLDLSLPDGDGRIELSRMAASAPVFVVSAYCDRETVGECFDLGAHEFFEKPVNIGGLASALRGLSGQRSGRRLNLRGVRIDLDDGSVENLSRNHTLTESEVKILTALWEHRNSTVSRRLLIRAAWGSTPDDDRALDVRISRLRKKIEHYPDDPRVIRSVDGGFILEHPSSAIRAGTWKPQGLASRSVPGMGRQA
jgi:DNA-binding response OmpR family regulator